jgi:predicted DNA-binding protein YlxM (UPF0122 family)
MKKWTKELLEKELRELGTYAKVASIRGIPRAYLTRLIEDLHAARSYTALFDSQIKALLKEGSTVPEIGRKLGIAKATIRSYAQKNHYRIPNLAQANERMLLKGFGNYSAGPYRNREQLTKDLAEFGSFPAVAKHYGVSKQIIYYHRKRLNLPFPERSKNEAARVYDPQIEALLKEGLNLPEISRILNIKGYKYKGLSFIRSRCARNGFKVPNHSEAFLGRSRPKQSKLTPKMLKQVKVLYEGGWSLALIAKKYKVTPYAIGYRLHKGKVHLRPRGRVPSKPPLINVTIISDR